jgi:Enoyl-(Acyl carrier protein) reductase
MAARFFAMSYHGAVIENYGVMGPVKAALESAMRYLAAELGPKGIRVHAISPGPLATRAASGIPDFDALMERVAERAPARRLVTIEEVGAACVFLASRYAGAMTGDTICDAPKSKTDTSRCEKTCSATPLRSRHFYLQLSTNCTLARFKIERRYPLQTKKQRRHRKPINVVSVRQSNRSDLTSGAGRGSRAFRC